ncbi:phage baseplate protein [Salinivibrio costicola]|uniref:phage baseplate protein n=1 Tax=Salinivibrio costicola TaxID=51367 RepID=UPI000395DD69|nr:hypothetical protein [Salinivibrio costicola]
MAFYYLLSKDGDNIICLDAENNISVSRNNTASTSSIMSGAVKTDGFEIGNRVVTINGVLTYSKSPRQKIDGNPTPLSFQRLLDELVKSKQRFTLFSNKRGEQLFDDIDDCIILSHSVQSRDLNSISASITIQEQFVTDAATVVPNAVISAKHPGLTQESDQGSGTSTEVEASDYINNTRSEFNQTRAK